MQTTLDAPFDLSIANVSPRTWSNPDNATPNTRLSSWAEQRNLSIDTDRILAHGGNLRDKRENRFDNFKRSDQRRKRREDSSQSTHSEDNENSSRTENRKPIPGQPKHALIGCFSFLVSSCNELEQALFLLATVNFIIKSIETFTRVYFPLNSSYVSISRMSAALSALRDYVTAADAGRYSTLPEGFVRIDVTHSNLNQRWHDVLVFLGSTVLDLKQKLFKKNGTLIDSMELFVRNGTKGGTLFMADDSKTFEYYGGCNGCEVHIRDNDPFSISANGALENLSLVPKYVMPDEVYDKLPNTLRSHIRNERNKDPNFKINLVNPSEKTNNRAVYTPEDEDKPSTPVNAEHIYSIGSRCEVQPGGRRGEVKYLGAMAGLKGTWVGVDLDEPLGHNNGTGIDGVRYFTCKGDSYGCFAKTYNVQVGNQFVERDPLESSSDDEI